MTESLAISVEVIQVANGWLVRPPYDIQDRSESVRSQIYVFGTFAELVTWLREHFQVNWEAEVEV
jgi:hypothetical protein